MMKEKYLTGANILLSLHTTHTSIPSFPFIYFFILAFRRYIGPQGWIFKDSLHFPGIGN